MANLSELQTERQLVHQAIKRILAGGVADYQEDGFSARNLSLQDLMRMRDDLDSRIAAIEGHGSGFRPIVRGDYQ